MKKLIVGATLLVTVVAVKRKIAKKQSAPFYIAPKGSEIRVTDSRL